MKAIGIDIGGTRLRAARVSPDGVIEARFAEPIVRDPKTLIDRILARIAELDAKNVRAIGIGVPGRVDAAKRTVLSGGYVDLAGIDIAERVEAATGRPVFIDNDGTMALVAEAAIGAARGVRNVVMLTIGTGIGGAVMADGRIVRGRRSAGQLGHIVVDPAGYGCACGRDGCVETFSSGTALRRLMSEAGYVDFVAVEDLLAATDARAKLLIVQWAGPLRRALDSLAAAFDPDLFVLGGGLGIAANQAVARTASGSSWFDYAVAAADLGDDAGVIGAALAALDGGVGQ